MRLLLFLILFISCSQKKDTAVQLKFQSFVGDGSDISCFRVLVERLGNPGQGKCWKSGKASPDFNYEQSTQNIMSGGQFSLMLSSNTNYRFHLVGLDNTINCVNPDLSGLNESSVKIYHLSHVDKYIEAGKENIVSLNSSSEGDQVSRCDGAGFFYCKDCFLIGVDKLDEGNKLGF